MFTVNITVVAMVNGQCNKVTQSIVSRPPPKKKLKQTMYSISSECASGDLHEHKGVLVTTPTSTGLC